MTTVPTCERCGDKSTEARVEVCVLDRQGCWERLTVCYRCKSDVDSGELSAVIAVLLLIALIAYGMSTGNEGKRTLDKSDVSSKVVEQSQQSR